MVTPGRGSSEPGRTGADTARGGVGPGREPGRLRHERGDASEGGAGRNRPGPDRFDRNRPGGDPPDRDRAQIMLVGAVALAIALVGVVVVLNTVLYTENVATRGAISSIDEGEAFVSGVESDLQGMLATLSRNESYVEMATLPANVSNYSRHAALARASEDVALVNVSLNGTTSTVHSEVVQDGGGSLTDASGAANWDLVDDANASEVVAFEMTLDGNPPSSDKFTINVTNDSAGTWWRLQVYKSAPEDTQVDTGNHAGPLTACAVELGEPVTINTTHVVGNRTTCTHEFARGVSPPYSVSVSKGNFVDGNYSIVVNGSVPSGSVNQDCSLGPPCVESRVTAAAFDVVYVTPELTFERTVRVPVPDDDLPGAGRTLVASDFESGDLSGTEWTGTGSGTVSVTDAANDSGQYAAVHDGPGGGSIALNHSLNTSGDDWVMVTWWVQEGNATHAPDAADSPSEDLVFEYLAPNGTWLAVERANATGTPGRTATHRVDLTHPSTLHDALEVRFRKPGSSDADPWYVDDVTVQAGETA